MELNWSTYLLEIVNFAVLVWILKRFLYQPVMAVIVRRRQGVEKTLADAQKTREEAAALKTQFEGRLADWDREKQQGRADLQHQLDELRRQRLSELEQELAAASERARVRDEKRLQAAAEAGERDALALAASFSTRLLERVADPTLEVRLVHLALDDISALAPEQRDRIRDALQASPSLRVQSAFPLAEPEIEAIRQAFEKLAGKPVECSFEQDANLLAGVRITAGAWVLQANLQDELAGFASLASDGRRT
jgi:F-type H+-transporting ATPase subunit b